MTHNTSMHTPAYTYIHIHTCVHRFITQTHMHTHTNMQHTYKHATHTPLQTQRTYQEQIPMKTTSPTSTNVITTMMIMYTVGRLQKGREERRELDTYVSYHKVSIPSNGIH